MTDWNIQSRGRACEACGNSFANKEPYHTLLFDERSDWRRLDVCESCWQKQYSEARDRKGFVSHWQGVFEVPPPPNETIQKATAESLLRKLIELNEPRYIPAGYILAVMLERKRLLKVKDQLAQDGRRVFIYEQPGTGDVFTIVDPALQLDQLEAVQRDVAHLLEHGLNPPASTAGDAAQPSDPVDVAAEANSEIDAQAIPPEPGKEQ
jgi:hypothetical protein